MSAEVWYRHYISLGYFCSVAMELERIGLRSASYPFDWLITPDLSNVMKYIRNGFDGFLEVSEMIQDAEVSSTYINRTTGFKYVHDFKASIPAAEQIDDVALKYRRRIDRFYRDITEPTLFVRYISDEKVCEDGRYADLSWIEDNITDIEQTLRSYNPDNRIIWIGNSALESTAIPIYTVDKDEGDSVARKPLEKNVGLNDLLMNAYYPEREKNLEVYRAKMRKKNSPIARIRRKLFG